MNRLETFRASYARLVAAIDLLVCRKRLVAYRAPCLRNYLCPRNMISEIQLLGGKVTKRTLSLVQPSSTPDSPTLKRLMLPQGELVQFYDGGEGIRYIAQIELQAGSVRGNHYHNTKQEWIYVISGELTLIVQDLDSNARESTSLLTGDLAFIQTGVAHALQVTKSGQAIEFSTSRFDPADIYRHKLV